MSAAFYPLPTTFPSAEAAYLLGYLRGQAFDASQTLHAAWGLAGFGMAQMSSQPQMLATAPMDLEQALSQLATVPAGSQALFGNFDWKSLLKLVIEQVVMKLLAGG